MKRCIGLIITAALVATLAVGVPAALTCYRAPGTITIDGTLAANEWTWADSVALSLANDNSATVKVLWDNTNLYVAFQVQDADLWSDAKPNPWETFLNDSVEIVHDALNDGGTAPQTDDHRFHVDFQDLAMGVPHGQTNGGEVGTGIGWGGWGPASASWAATLQGTANDGVPDTGFTYELSISWADLGGTPTAGSTDGVTFRHYDDDLGGAAEGDGVVPGTNVDVPDTYIDMTFSSLAAAPVTAYRAPGTVTVDGVLTEWTLASVIPLMTANNNTALGRVMWDNTFLYVAIEVADTQLWGDAKPNPWETWRNDSVEIYHDALNDGGAAPQIDDHSFHVDFQDLAMGVPHSQTNGGEVGTGSGWAGWGPAAAQWAAVLTGTANNNADTDTGWVYEIAVDWASIGGMPTAGDTDGFCLIYGDDDDGGDVEGWGGTPAFTNSVPDNWLDLTYSPLVPVELSVFSAD